MELVSISLNGKTIKSVTSARGMTSELLPTQRHVTNFKVFQGQEEYEIRADRTTGGQGGLTRPNRGDTLCRHSVTTA